jgi:hypothetical protein
MDAMSRTDIVVGGVQVGVRATNAEFIGMLESRYAGFLGPPASAHFEFDVEIGPAREDEADEDVRVYRDGALWRIERGDFRARLDPVSRRGHIRQSANPYSLDSVLRIVHTLVLAGEGGFLFHAASAVVDGRALVFAGVSGAGKTTISRLAPPRVTLLSDEISFVRRAADGYLAHGTPFAGELARAGENVSAPLSAIYLLEKDASNEITPVAHAEALRSVLANVLFFARDGEMVRAVLDAAADLVERVPVRRLRFVPEASVWDAIAADGARA